ncbi:hypothetical protein DV515_00009431 [Chloebia gouldiae]|uniref:Uncharacterized protein n=1 Tax=Chloebia gouldiae TaxID=44316 RepID=A0A3L8SD53_CHLGU|nr:hypothetical protein DV515_00009431 [Chloebia gouldiae]
MIQETDWSLSDVVGMENHVTCYKAQMLPKLKVIGKLIEEISCSPSSPRLEPMKLKPNRSSKDPLQELILTLKQQQIALKDVIASCSSCSSMFVWSKSFLDMEPWNETPAVQSRGTQMVQCDSARMYFTGTFSLSKALCRPLLKVSKNQIFARADVKKRLKCFSTAPSDVPQVPPRVRVAPPEHRCAPAALVLQPGRAGRAPSPCGP